MSGITVEELQSKSAYSDDVCGCFLGNYQKQNVCPVGTGGWCKDLVKCRSLQRISDVILNERK